MVAYEVREPSNEYGTTVAGPFPTFDEARDYIDDGNRHLRSVPGQERSRRPWTVVEIADLDLIGVREAARIAGVTPSAIQQAHHRGRMPETVPIAGTDVLVWHRDDVERWVERRRQAKEMR